MLATFLLLFPINSNAIAMTALFLFCIIIIHCQTCSLHVLFYLVSDNCPNKFQTVQDGDTPLQMVSIFFITYIIFKLKSLSVCKNTK